MRNDPDIEGWCETCHQPCFGVYRDDGIGPYEYWGSKGVHHDWVVVSNCCEALVLSSNPCCSECGKDEVYDFGVCFDCYEKSNELS